jgi:hypothetical protein
MMVPSDDAILTHCHVCFSSVIRASLEVCSGCKLVRYCSAMCRDSDQHLHEKECKAIAEFMSTVPGVEPGQNPFEKGMVTAVNRMSARLMWQRSRMGEDWWKPIEELAHYMRQRGAEDTTPQQLMYYLLKYHEACTSPQEDIAKALKECLGVLHRVRNNAFCIYKGDEKLDLGVALSAVGALFNHSCVPNMSYEYPDGPGAKNCLHFRSV